MRTINLRYKGHGGDTYFSRAYLKAKDRFTWDIIMCDDIEDAYDLEALMVDEGVVGSSNFYNLQLGGSSKYTISEETRVKMSETAKGRDMSKPIAAAILANTGLIRGEQEASHKQAFLKSRKPSGYPKLISPDGVIHEFTCRKTFAESQGLRPASISAVISGARNHHKGWKLAPTTNQEGN